MKDIELPPLPERIREFADGADIEAIEEYGRECARAAVEANSVPDGWPTDADLTAIYKRANGEDTGKPQPLTTQRIFKAMRAILSASPAPAQQERKPMTDDDVVVCIEEAGFKTWTSAFFRLARLVERHHGIKE